MRRFGLFGGTIPTKNPVKAGAIIRQAPDTLLMAPECLVSIEGELSPYQP